MNDFDSKLNSFFNNLNDKLQQQFPNILAETATEYFKERFIYKDWDGVPWQPYGNPKREPKRGSLLNRSPGGLMSTIRPSVISPTLVRINAGSAKVPYARVHNEGLRVRAVQYVRPHHNNNFMGKGQRVQIQGHSRRIDFTMPRRQFMGKSHPLLNAVKNRFKTLIKP
ncbi:hypothetical protein FW774_17275 [Pedobacter sp. BS3]|uniref:phage virion morphogenesis protein n=1 Tax=Pedobacter sp. BS3 TaxID=2567937 RepID=UPI0011EC2C52|nr:phage virion morphogenesis protein [Pedobacter sp. BS3]TZF81808.1 hypothetical protein FW774_17275 [Pedobacter sp. BS3]